MDGYFSAAALIQASYLLTAFLFIMGLKRMSSPVTAVSGVRWAGIGMVLATIATLAPFVLAIFGFGALRNVAMFIAMYIAGAALTAPFALARLAATG